MPRKCLACGRRPPVTLPECPPVCDACLRRSGREPIRPGDRVICDPEFRDATMRTVERVVDQGNMAVMDGGTLVLPGAVLICLGRRAGRVALK